MSPAPLRSVTLEWNDRGHTRQLLLTRIKIKPSWPNPILGLATLLSWAQQIGAGALAANDLPTLPASLALAHSSGGAQHPPGPEAERPGNGPIRDSTRASGARRGHGHADCGASESSGDRGDHPRVGCAPQGAETLACVLSAGAAWVLGHLALGQDPGEEHGSCAADDSTPPVPGLDMASGEVAALSMLSCPEIGWVPDPAAVRQALVDGGGSISGYTASAAGLLHEGGGGGGEGRRGQASGQGYDGVAVRGGGADASCQELVAAGLCSWSRDGSRLKLLPKVWSVWAGGTVLLSDARSSLSAPTAALVSMPAR